ncbi:hypothetical protein ACU635_37430 [[Actinomadura] parvosata]
MTSISAQRDAVTSISAQRDAVTSISAQRDAVNIDLGAPSCLPTI